MTISVATALPLPQINGMSRVWWAIAQSLSVIQCAVASISSPTDRFGSNSAVAAAVTLPQLWVGERYGPAIPSVRFYPLATASQRQPGALGFTPHPPVVAL